MEGAWVRWEAAQAVENRSAQSRFGRGSYRPGSFRPEPIRPWVVSAQFGGSFRPIFSQLSGLFCFVLIVV